MKILITGASGYIGGMLLKKMAHSQHQLRIFMRARRDYLEKSLPKTEFCYGDALNSEDVAKSVEGIDCVFYLIHTMATQGSFEDEDRLAAHNFAKACQQAGVKRIIYLGGLYQDDKPSSHMRSRREVGQILAESGVQVYEFRASVVIGAGSLSFEMIRNLVEHLPVMLCPRWVRQASQPIFIDDLIKYLVKSIDYDGDNFEIFEVGGNQRCSYRDLMLAYAKMRQLRRWLIPVPVLTPYLSSLWLSLVTPLYAQIGKKIIGSIRSSSIVENNKAEEIFAVHPISCFVALEKAVQIEDDGYLHCKWNEAWEAAGIPEEDFSGAHFGNRLVDSRSVDISASKESVFHLIKSIGGENGYYYGNTLWQLRGFIDLLAGGPGIKRGRRHPEDLHVGDVVDWWRVEDFDNKSRLILRAEMKLPGRAWLEYEVEGDQNNCRLRQTAIYDPIGVIGLLYWYAVVPLHEIVFNGMLRNIKKTALKNKE